jgi:hypothetical protein
MRLPLLICAAMAAGFAVQTWTMPHYFSLATGALYILLTQGMRHLWQWSPTRRNAGRAAIGSVSVGRALVRAIPVLACAMILLRVTSAAAHVSIEPAWPRGDLERSAVLSNMEQRPGNQLVIVRYGAHHDPVREWVYNEANIDAAKVVWARDMGKEGNQELLQYFRGRSAWLVEGDNPAPQPAPYSD